MSHSKWLRFAGDGERTHFLFHLQERYSRPLSGVPYCNFNATVRPFFLDLLENRGDIVVCVGLKRKRVCLNSFRYTGDQYYSDHTWPPSTLIWSATVCKSLSRLATNATRYPRALENSLLQRLSLRTGGRGNAHNSRCSGACAGRISYTGYNDDR